MKPVYFIGLVLSSFLFHCVYGWEWEIIPRTGFHCSRKERRPFLASRSLLQFYYDISIKLGYLLLGFGPIRRSNRYLFSDRHFNYCATTTYVSNDKCMDLAGCMAGLLRTYRLRNRSFTKFFFFSFSVHCCTIDWRKKVILGEVRLKNGPRKKEKKGKKKGEGYTCIWEKNVPCCMSVSTEFQLPKTWLYS